MGRRLFQSTGGADKVIDAVGPGLVPESLAALRGGGEVAVPGLIDLTNPVLDLSTMIGEVHGIRPVIERSVTFAEFPGAYRNHACAGVFGKTVIVVC